MKTHILSGIDRQDLYHPLLNGAKIGLMTNQTGINRLFRSTLDILHKNYQLTALMAVEHGIRGYIGPGDDVQSYTDEKTGIPVHSLYGQSFRPDESVMKSMELAVYDMQDVGARFYTYLTSLAYLMEACALYSVPLIVMDRLNPLGGLQIEGVLLENEVRSFVGEFPIPSRYGLTVGEYALLVRKLLQLDIDLTIIPLDGWTRTLYADDTDITFVPPSPNCPSVQASLCYVGTCIFEGTNVSEGRGTAMPFECIGAPWIDANKLAEAMRKHELPGVHFRPCSFRPSASKHRDSLCHGIQLHVNRRNEANLFQAGLLLCDTIRGLWPEHFEFLPSTEGDITHFDRLLGTKRYRLGQITAMDLINEQEKPLQGFRTLTQSVQLYS